MNVSFNGLDEKVATFECDSKIKEGTLVKITGNGKVSACVADDKFFGIVVNSTGKFCGVQYGGFVELPFTGNSATFGEVSLVAGSATEVKVAATAANGRVVNILCTSSKKLGILLD